MAATNKQKRKIYKLIDPNTLEVRYVGVTVGELSHRLHQHLSDARHRTGTHKLHWLKTLITNKQKPIIELIEEVFNWEEREKYWIKQFKRLTNTKEGGTGSIVNRSVDSVAKSAKAHTKQILQMTIKGKIVKTWESIKAASKELNISRTAIGNVLHKRSITAGGFHWMPFNEYYKGYKPIIKNNHSIKNTFKPKQIEVIINTKHFIFESISATALYFGVSSSLISGMLNGTRKSFVNTELRYSLA